MNAHFLNEGVLSAIRFSHTLTPDEYKLWNLLLQNAYSPTFLQEDKEYRIKGSFNVRALKRLMISVHCKINGQMCFFGLIDNIRVVDDACFYHYSMVYKEALTDVRLSLILSEAGFGTSLYF